MDHQEFDVHRRRGHAVRACGQALVPERDPRLGEDPVEAAPGAQEHPDRHRRAAAQGPAGPRLGAQPGVSRQQLPLRQDQQRRA